MNYDGYELLELAVEDGVQARTLRHPITGRTLRVFAFSGDQVSEFDQLCGRLGRLPSELTCVVDARRDPEAGYLITEGLPQGVGVVAWAEIVSRAPGNSLEERIYRAASRVKLRRKAVAALAV